MARVPLINRWFRRARRLHDIHHHSVNGTGHLDTILASAFPFDWIFGTLATAIARSTGKAWHIALQRYKLTMSSGSLRAKATAEGERGSNDGLHVKETARLMTLRRIPAARRNCARTLANAGRENPRPLRP